MVIDFHCLNFQEDSMHFDLYSAIPLALYKTSKWGPSFNSQDNILQTSIKKERQNNSFPSLWVPFFS